MTEEIKNAEVEDISETSDESSEEEETSKKPQNDSEIESKSKEEILELNKRIFARLKKEEVKTKGLEEKINKMISEKPSQTNAGNYDPVQVAGDMAALQGLDNYAQQKLIKDAKAFGKSLAEMRGDDDFALWLESHTAKVVKENTVLPSTKQGKAAPKNFKERLEAAKTVDEKGRLLMEMGLVHPKFFRKTRTETL